MCRNFACMCASARLRLPPPAAPVFSCCRATPWAMTACATSPAAALTASRCSPAGSWTRTCPPTGRPCPWTTNLRTLLWVATRVAMWPTLVARPVYSYYIILLLPLLYYTATTTMLYYYIILLLLCYTTIIYYYYITTQYYDYNVLRLVCSVFPIFLSFFTKYQNNKKTGPVYTVLLYSLTTIVK